MTKKLKTYIVVVPHFTFITYSGENGKSFGGYRSSFPFTHGTRGQ